MRDKGDPLLWPICSPDCSLSLSPIFIFLLSLKPLGQVERERERMIVRKRGRETYVYLPMCTSFVYLPMSTYLPYSTYLPTYLPYSTYLSSSTYPCLPNICLPMSTYLHTPIPIYLYIIAADPWFSIGLAQDLKLPTKQNLMLHDSFGIIFNYWEPNYQESKCVKTIVDGRSPKLNTG